MLTHNTGYETTGCIHSAPESSQKEFRKGVKMSGVNKNTLLAGFFLGKNAFSKGIFPKKKSALVREF